MSDFSFMLNAPQIQPGPTDWQQNALNLGLKQQNLDAEAYRQRQQQEMDQRLLEQARLPAPYMQDVPYTQETPGASQADIQSVVNPEVQAYMQSPEAQAAAQAQMQQQTTGLPATRGGGAQGNDEKKQQIMASIKKAMEEKKRAEMLQEAAFGTQPNIETRTRQEQVTPKLSGPQTAGAAMADQRQAAQKEAARQKRVAELDNTAQKTFNQLRYLQTPEGKISQVMESFARRADAEGLPEVAIQYRAIAESGAEGKKKEFAPPKVNTFTKAVMRDGKLQEVLFDKATGEEIKDLGGARPGAAGGGRGMKGFIQSKTIPGAMFNREDGKTYIDVTRNGQPTRIPMDTATVQEQTTYWTPQMKKLQQQGGIKAVNAYVAADTYKSEATELMAIRDRIAKNNPGVFSGVGSDLRKVNNVAQWARLNTSDDPDLAEFIKGTTLLADVLMNAVGGAQGGQWAFELASKLLDPSQPREAYQATIDKHYRTLSTKAKNYSGVGTNRDSSSFKEQPDVPGASKKPSGVPNDAVLLKGKVDKRTGHGVYQFKNKYFDATTGKEL